LLDVCFNMVYNYFYRQWLNVLNEFIFLFFIFFVNVSFRLKTCISIVLM
jgi:hypothetical protein